MTSAPEKGGVVQLIPDLSMGGAETMCTDLLLGLRAAGVPVALVTFFPTIRKRYREPLEDAGVAITTLGKRMGPDPALPGRLRAALRRLGPGVLHSHRYALRYLLLARAGNLVPRWVHTLHSPWLHEHPASRLLLRLPAGSPPRLVGVSDGVVDSLPARIRSRGRAAVVWNGVPLPGRNGKLAESGRSTLLWMGRLEPPKRPDLVLEAVSRMQKDHPEGREIRLLVAGEGSLLPSLRTATERLGLTGTVRFLGAVEGTDEVLAQAQVLCLASTYEGSPIAVLEAQARGLAVVASDVGGLRGSLAPVNQELLVPENEGEAWGRALQRALDPVLQDRAAREGPAWVRNHRSVEGMVEGYRALYR